MSKIKVNSNKCTGCMICELVCSIAKNEEVNPKRARIRVKETFPIPGSPIVCSQCKKPLCREVCPVNAIEINDVSITINYDKCTKCMKCVKVCPFNAVFIDVKDGKPIICDLCNGDPQCVKYCPKGALIYE